ncbi:MAG: FAD:protein FMN transferase [Bernardetiaceae bacterium]
MTSNEQQQRKAYQRKNLIYGFGLLTLMGIVYLYRNAQAPPPPQPATKNLIYFSGQTMGRITYNVKYIDPTQTNYQGQVDELLRAFNQSLSTYIPDSEISRFNAPDSDTLTFESPYFPVVLVSARRVWEITEGAFDPTVFPLVSAWGFGPNKKDTLPETAVDSLLGLVNFPALGFDAEKVWKSDTRIQLDFSAIAKGQAVDVVADFLAQQGIQNYLVEIGGELRAAGKNDKGEAWTVGIEDPIKAGAGERALLARLSLDGKGMATSGNYRNFYYKNGRRYVHTIDPKTGFPIEHQLLSVSVIAPTCMEADAFATAFMVMGLEKAQQIIANQPQLQAFFIYETESGIQTAVTPGLSVERLDAPKP